MGCLSSKDRRNFRGSSYSHNVLLGKRTVKDGECAVVWNWRGRYSRHPGPFRVWLFMSQVAFLDRHVADEDHYLEVKLRDGRTDHVRGPAAQFMDPVLHTSIRVLDAVKLDSSEVCVVYREDTAAAGAPQGGPEGVRVPVERRIIRGPAVFVPGAREWVHEFRWTEGAERPRRDGGHAFTKLSLAPAQLSVRAAGVRTRDDAKLEVAVQCSYEVADIERLLARTQDATGDLSSACTADLAAFASSVAYAELLEAAARLSDAATYPTLASRAEWIGLRVLEVASVGFVADAAVQAVHSKSREDRAALKAAQEAAEQEQGRLDMEQQRAAERAKRERSAEAESTAFELGQGRLRLEDELARRRAQHTAALGEALEEREAAAEAERGRMEAEEAHLAQLKALGVDLTELLVCQAKARQQPAGSVLQIEGAVPAHVHLHREDAAGTREAK
eukprot:m51a1_g11171 hypothetical protein (446) ;mRNA; f:306710-308178